MKNLLEKYDPQKYSFLIIVIGTVLGILSAILIFSIIPTSTNAPSYHSSGCGSR